IVAAAVGGQQLSWDITEFRVIEHPARSVYLLEDRVRGPNGPNARTARCTAGRPLMRHARVVASVLLLAAVVLAPNLAHAVIHHVTTTGSSAGDGSIASPYDLATGL